jgi:acyl transferase domain-containing protein
MANPLIISSIKGNIGHCEAASGAAGLAKLLLMLREKKMPVQVGHIKTNPRFGDLESSGFIIPRLTTTWNNNQKTPRRALLNNFGAAGSNASLLLEEWVEPVSALNKTQVRSAYVFILSAKSQKALQRAVQQHIQFLQNLKGRPSLENICYTATARRQIQDYRVSLVCNSVNDLCSKLEHLRAVEPDPSRRVSATIFVFSGQGGLYEGMGQELMNTLPLFRDVILECDRTLQTLGHPSILSFLYTDHEKTKPLNAIDNVIASHCACVALEYALAKMVMSWGVVPQYVIGHRYVTTLKMFECTYLELIMIVSVNILLCACLVC